MNTNEFQSRIGILFKDDRILKEALTHRSYLNENEDWPYDHNERLEFLGDAVLELAVTRHIFRVFPKMEEGDLTMMRAALVNTKILAKIAEEIRLKEHLSLSKGEGAQGGRAIETILADAFEALIGAIYLDQGYDKAEEFIKDRVLSRIDEIKKQGYKDAKSVLQEKTQEKIKLIPVYKVMEEFGPEHQKVFKVGVYFGKELAATGEGPSKQEAETQAAKKALANFS
jgi:ribonuclease-3